MLAKDYVKVTKEYYDGIAHEVYKETWGGENHHLGLFDNTDDFCEAAKKANENLLKKLNASGNEKILDVGSGFCGLPRYLAYQTGCHVTGLNLSTKENDYAKNKNKEEGLDNLITVVEGDFNNMPFNDGEFDVLVSQDAMLHSPDKVKLLEECSRVLKPGGRFVFSEIMENSALTPDEAKTVYARINVPYMASYEFYKRKLPEFGIEVREIQDLGSINLGKSYKAVHDNLLAKKDYLMKERNVPEDVINNTLEALMFWVNKAYKYKLDWGLFSAHK
ncbi:MAG: methyltransferase domain-containing protein [Clostridiales bacterium]|nr:methyltransferase domain-containing protein [Clostridiales bacterium]MCF8023319.1 methyltransferase domain-containing protein [Clostridiales bacterium]